MTSLVENLNVVIIGENFPVTSIRADDFTFRGRKFREQMRLGPALQATSRNVSFVVLPDRFQVTVAQVDDVEKQIEGVIEVVAVFKDYVGRRSITQVGHNAQVLLGDEAEFQRITAGLVNMEAAAQVIQPEGEMRTSVMFDFKRGHESTAKMAVGRTEAGVPSLDFNFHFELDSLDLNVDEAVAYMPESMNYATSIAQGLRDQYTATGVGQ